MKRACDFEIAGGKVLKMDQSETPMDVSLIVNHDRISKNSALSLVELAREIEKANSHIKSSTSTKLKMITDQVRYLQRQAENILIEAKRNIKLHEISCNFVKQPGHIYHLFQRSSGELYFSMISPEEWGKSGPKQEYKGSFRLEFDQSWTPVSDIPDVDTDMKSIQNVVENNLFGNSTVPFITNQPN